MNSFSKDYFDSVISDINNNQAFYIKRNKDLLKKRIKTLEQNLQIDTQSALELYEDPNSDEATRDKLSTLVKTYYSLMRHYGKKKRNH